MLYGVIPGNLLKNSIGSVSVNASNSLSSETGSSSPFFKSSNKVPVTLASLK